MASKRPKGRPEEKEADGKEVKRLTGAAEKKTSQAGKGWKPPLLRKSCVYEWGKKGGRSQRTSLKKPNYDRGT